MPLQIVSLKKSVLNYTLGCFHLSINYNTTVTLQYNNVTLTIANG